MAVALSQESYDFKLWHYTKYSAYKDILSSHALWATDYRHLNDQSEVIYSKAIVLEALLPSITKIVEYEYVNNAEAHRLIMRGGGVDAISRLEAADTVEILYNALIESPSLSNIPYVLSFCETRNTDTKLQKQGLLSQWRGYGSDGGVALIFDAKEISEQFKKEIGAFYYGIAGEGPVAYGANSSRTDKNLKEALKCIRDFAIRLYRFRLYKESLGEVQRHELRALVECMMRHKHDGFSEENEYRFYSFPYEANAVEHKAFVNDKNKQFKNIKTRYKHKQEIKYVEYFEKCGQLPIEKIIVGPHRDKEGRANEIRDYLTSKGLNSVSVEISEIPFIGN